ncbi:hypothetical protein HV819_02685 [Anaerococcus sp. AGMB00486]|uniref:Phage protein n=2 Tax=Anaerococcus TaxID=165779 RepID=A0ABX2N874_9FIRM|nr:MULTISPECIES: DUF6275 family protein [Anaerococcus]MSS77296.1 hypothetical protein [Anaerococcus porci]NVF10901.1 hypothetical protein [Anaerococcus faecalis]
MDSYKFQKACKEWLIKYYSEKFGKSLEIEDIFVVWSCKTLQNNKVLISTTLFDGVYVECTYNGDKQETYFDIYKKQENILVSNGELIG